jgi:Zn-dependent membrane protease YugP
MEPLGFFFYQMEPVYLIMSLALMALMMIVQGWVHAAYSKYSRIPNERGITGAEAAQVILRQAGISDVRVELHQGWLSDHYSPREKVLRLSPHNYSEPSIAAVGIAAHEAGHAIQHASRYAPLVLRNVVVPVAGIGSNLGLLMIFIGLAINSLQLGVVGLILFAGVAVFQIVNLPVEFDASRRALEVLPATGILSPEETRGARNVLTAAAMTYVAATVAIIAQVIYFAWRLGLFSGGSRDNR